MEIVTSSTAGSRATPAPNSPLWHLLNGPVGPGAVAWLGLRPGRHEAMHPVDAADAALESGLVGDHYAGRSFTRQVSLIGAENLASIGSFLGTGPADPHLLRRNVVVTGVNLLALKGRRFRLGTAVLAYTGDCHPCSRMETLLGPGGYNAVRGHGGILARVVQPGTITLGGKLIRLDEEPAGSRHRS